MGDAGRGRDASPVHSLAIVLRGRKGSTGGEAKHCCSANRVVERCCIIANAIALVSMNGRHTPARTHARVCVCVCCCSVVRFQGQEPWCVSGSCAYGAIHLLGLPLCRARHGTHGL